MRRLPVGRVQEIAFRNVLPTLIALTALFLFLLASVAIANLIVSGGTYLIERT